MIITIDGPAGSGKSTVARKLAAPSSGRGMYVIDGYGGVHPLDGAMPIFGAPYFGWDVLRDFAIFEVTASQAE